MFLGIIAGALMHVPAGAATIMVNNLNAAGEGFNDPTPVEPVPGNPATTLGGQRLAAFQAAASEWAALLVSPVTIVIDAEMVSLNCSTNSATLGSAGPTGSIASDFSGAPFPGTWYPQAMVNALLGEDIDPARSDVAASFNKDIGTPGCLESLGWSYVIGAPAPPGTIPFTNTVRHEIAHGLGFLTFVNKSTGAYCCPGLRQPDHYARFLLDETPTPTLWTAMNDLGRKDSAVDDGNLTWSGGRVAEVAATLSAGRHASGRVRMYAPATLSAGSSVSHWDTVVTPNELMEPFLQADALQRLTNHLMLDIGWPAQIALAVGVSDGLTTITAGAPINYVLTIAHEGPADLSVIDAVVNDTFPAALEGVTWGCAGSGGASCAAVNGTGDVDTTVSLPLGGVITFTVDATVNPGFSGELENTVSVSLPAQLQNTLPSSATDLTNVTAGGPAAGITVSPVSGNTTEAGGTMMFTVVLDSAPTATVTIGLASSDLTEGTVAPDAVLFDAGNWSVPQEVIVTGVDDAVDDGDILYAIITAPALSDDGAYAGLDPVDVTLANLDDDTAGISVSGISGHTSEAGDSATFTMVLNSEPTAAVTVGLSSSDTTEGTVQPAQFEFTPGSWNVPQQAVVTGVDDALVDGDIEYFIVTAPAVSSDPKYDGIDPPDVAVTNLDDGFDDLIFRNSFE